MKMDDHEYGELVMDRAYQYLHQVLLYDRQGKKMLWRSTYFWTWWSRQWERRNTLLISELHLHTLWDTPVDEELAAWVRHEFMQVHSIYKLNIMPNRLVLASSFSAMVKAGILK
jgi:hypothetical protein